MYIILVAVAFCVQALGANKALRILYLFLAGLITVSFIAAVLSTKMPFFAFASHPDDELDQSLVGAWRGLMPHKNVAGAIMIHSSIFFFHHAINRGRKADWLFFAMAVIFLVMTKSKTSVGWFAFVLMAGMAYRFAMVRRAPAAFVFGTGVFLFFLAIFAYALQDVIYAFLTNPLSLSGRVEIWQSLFPYIYQHPFLGSGYGSFWAIGYDSPIFQTARTLFITQIGHSHSGYIEILLTTGGIGLGLALIALLIVPYIRFATPIPGDALLNPMLFSIWLFGMVQNMSESQFFSPDKQSWIFVVIAIVIMHTRHLASKRRNFDWLRSTAWMPCYGARPETSLLDLNRRRA
jgi:O-antigen ligase